MFIDTQVDLALFFILTVMVFHKAGDMFTKHRAYHKWYQENQAHIWLPHHALFPIVWFLICVSIDASMYIFVKQYLAVWPTDTYVVPTVAILFLINMWISKRWSRTLILHRQIRLAFVMALVWVGTGVGILVVFGLQKRYVELGCFVGYVVWPAAALCLNWHIWNLAAHQKINEPVEVVALNDLTDY
jgi:tryptophan-rich sensory protein